MSYQSARNNFQENLNLIGPDPMADPQNWNLNHGLLMLANELDGDTVQIKNALSAIMREIDRLKMRVG
jgi:hypothetical protein